MIPPHVIAARRNVLLKSPGTQPARIGKDPPPAGVEIRENMFGNKHHYFEWRPGHWSPPCEGRRRCPECLKETAKMTTIDRISEVLEEHLGLSATGVAVDAGFQVFGATIAEMGQAGSEEDRLDLICSLEREFVVCLERELVEGAVTVGEIAAVIELRMAEQRLHEL